MSKDTQNRVFDLSPKEEAVLASVLTHDRYGLEIIEAVKKASDEAIQLGFGSLYPTLHKLEKKGFLKARWGDETLETRGGARRRYYSITVEGEKVLKEKKHMLQKLTAWQPVFSEGV